MNGKNRLSAATNGCKNLPSLGNVLPHLIGFFVGECDALYRKGPADIELADIVEE